MGPLVTHSSSTRHVCSSVATVPGRPKKLVEPLPCDGLVVSVMSTCRVPSPPLATALTQSNTNVSVATSPGLSERIAEVSAERVSPTL